MITDLHVDYNYHPGASNVCAKDVCCRFDSGQARTPETKALKWGDYKCDLPSYTLDNMLDFINRLVRPDVVFWGGDSDVEIQEIGKVVRDEIHKNMKTVPN